MPLPDWIQPLSELTRDDVISSGACREGVEEWMDGKTLRAAMQVTTLLKLADDSDHHYILSAARLDGYGYGYGDGDGDGDGYGDGDGDGDGYGDGYGYG